MSFLSRLRNIIRSNINFSNNNYRSFSDNFQNFEFEEDFDEHSKQQVFHEENNVEKEYYAILEVRYGSNFDEIKKAYKKLLKKYHPDLFHNNPEKFEKAQKLTEKINEAYSYFEKKYK